jgi:hypothetical protein
MQIGNSGPQNPREHEGDMAAADKFARMMDEIFVDIDDLDPFACPPDRRFFLRDKEAWVYEHGNVCELVFVRTVEPDGELPTG